MSQLSPGRVAAVSDRPKVTTHTIRMLRGKRPIVAVTAYDALTAIYADEAGVDFLLVGDSMGNAVLGFPHTVAVTLDMMVHHTAAVARMAPKALLVADLPFGSAHYEFRRVLASSQRLMQQGGADAVKIEGGVRRAPTIARLTDAGVPVCGHIGLQPQQVQQLGRYAKQGKGVEATASLVADARALAAAGCFAIVVELTTQAAVQAVRAAIEIPVIGIGAGPDCDGQILVWTDLMGLTPGGGPSFAPSFVDGAKLFREGFAAFTAEVRSGQFARRGDEST